MNEIYLDNNATTQIDSSVAQTLHDASLSFYANPSGQHQSGRLARRRLEEAREVICQKLGCQTQSIAADSLIFTSGGTESNNLALMGLTENVPGQIVVSAIEHPSVLAMAERLAKRGRTVRYLPVDDNGTVSLTSLQSILDEHTVAVTKGDPEKQVALVSIMSANNETGVLQPIQPIASACRQAQVLIHTDAVQSLGKQPLGFREWDVDAMTVTAHKIHGPIGIGALLVRHGVRLTPQAFGGAQQLEMRPGTESVALAIAFEKALCLSVDKVNANAEYVSRLRDRLESKLLDCNPTPFVVGRHVNRLPNTICVAFPGLERQQLQMGLDRSGIACSTGSACASGSAQVSHVLKAMKLPQAVTQGAIRISLSRFNTDQEIDEAADRIRDTVGRLSRMVALA